MQCVLKDKLFLMELPVVNHPDYVAKINDDNKFPIKKFGALAEYLLKIGIVKKLDKIIPTRAVSKWPKKIFFGCAKGLSGYPYKRTMDDPNDAIRKIPREVL